MRLLAEGVHPTGPHALVNDIWPAEPADEHTIHVDDLPALEALLKDVIAEVLERAGDEERPALEEEASAALTAAIAGRLEWELHVAAAALARLKAVAGRRPSLAPVRSAVEREVGAEVTRLYGGGALVL